MTVKIKSMTVEQLQVLIQLSQAELQNRNTDDWFIKIRSNAAAVRAVTVAAVQKQAILFIDPDTAPLQECCNAARSLGITARFIVCCPCGKLSDYYQPCSCSPARIHQYWRRKEHQKMLDQSELVIEVGSVHPRDVYKNNPDYDLGYIKEQLNNATDISIISGEINEVSQQLVKTACEQVMSTKDVPAMIKTAKSIAALDGVDKIEVQHLAEAIQYRRYKSRL